MENIINFISNIDNSTYNKIRHSKSDAECRRYLKDQLTKQLNLTDVMQWVAVEDALPPIELDVLVWDEFNVYITNRLDSNYIVWDESTQILDGVTHWMPMPEPPCA